MDPSAERTLRKTPLFGALSEEEFSALRGRVTTRKHNKGEILFNEGDPCRGLYIIGAGKVRIYKMASSGREQVLSVEGPGSSFAELPVFDGGNYPASAAAAEDLEVLFISRKDFQDFCREHPEVALKVIAVVGARLRRLVSIIEELSFTTIRQRLIAMILRLAQTNSTRSAKGIQIEFQKSQQDLAAELGTVRELISRNLGRLQAEGYLEVDGRSILIKDIAGLKREQESAD
jgi:CRP-like cAMP-binding protein